MNILIQIAIITIVINYQQDTINCDHVYKYFHSITENELVWLWETPPQCLNRDSIPNFIYYPDCAIKKGIEGTVIIELIIDENGQPRCPKILKSLCEEIDNEAIRVVDSLEFLPAFQGNEPVMSFITLPVRFELSGQKKQKKCRRNSVN